jgi:hypothetical protein
MRFINSSVISQAANGITPELTRAGQEASNITVEDNDEKDAVEASG